MYPHNAAALHPAAKMLLKYANHGCLVDCGQDWTIAEIQNAIDRGAHPSAQTPDAAKACRAEALERVKDGCYKVVKWSTIKHKPPDNLK